MFDKKARRVSARLLALTSCTLTNAIGRYRLGRGFSETFERSESSRTSSLTTGDKIDDLTLPCNTVCCSRSWHCYDCLSVSAQAITQHRLTTIGTECAIK